MKETTEIKMIDIKIISLGSVTDLTLGGSGNVCECYSGKRQVTL